MLTTWSILQIYFFNFAWVYLSDAPIPFFKNQVRVPICFSQYSLLPMPVPMPVHNTMRIIKNSFKMTNNSNTVHYEKRNNFMCLSQTKVSVFGIGAFLLVRVHEFSMGASLVYLIKWTWSMLFVWHVWWFSRHMSPHSAFEVRWPWPLSYFNTLAMPILRRKGFFAELFISNCLSETMCLKWVQQWITAIVNVCI